MYFFQRSYDPETDSWTYLAVCTSEDFLPDAIEPRYLSLILVYPEESGLSNQQILVDDLYNNDSIIPDYENGKFTLDEEIFAAQFTAQDHGFEPERVLFSGSSSLAGDDFDFLIESSEGNLAFDLDLTSRPPKWVPPSPEDRPCDVSLKPMRPIRTTTDRHWGEATGVNAPCQSKYENNGNVINPNNRPDDHFQISHYSIGDVAEGNAACHDTGDQLSEVFTLSTHEHNGVHVEHLSSNLDRLIKVEGLCMLPACQEFRVEIQLKRAFQLTAEIDYQEYSGAIAGVSAELKTRITGYNGDVSYSPLSGAIRISGSQNPARRSFGGGFSLGLFPPSVGISGSITPIDEPQAILPEDRSESHLAMNHMVVDSWSRSMTVRTQALSALSVLAQGHCRTIRHNFGYRRALPYSEQYPADAFASITSWYSSVSPVLILEKHDDCYIDPSEHP